MPVTIRRPFLIGQSPSRYTQERDGPDVEPAPFSGLSGNRLAAVVGLSLDDFLARVQAVNLLTRFPGRSGNGDAFDLEAATTAAASLLPRLAGRTAILAGQNVAAAFGVSLRSLEAVVIDGVRWALLPHPSGVNRWWNSAANFDAAKAFLIRELMIGRPYLAT